MNRTDRKLFVQIVGQMLITDGVLADAERSYLDRLMESLGMDPTEQKDALREISLDSPLEERVSALSGEARDSLLAEAEKAMAIDGRASNSEQALLERIRALVG